MNRELFVLMMHAALAVALAIFAIVLVISITVVPMRRNYLECGKITLCQPATDTTP